MGAMTITSVYCLFFDGYETLDVMGPIDFLHRVTDVRMRYILVALKRDCPFSDDLLFIGF